MLRPTGVVIVNHDGIPIRSTIADLNLTVQYAGLATQLADKSRSMVRDLDPQVGSWYPGFGRKGTFPPGRDNWMLRNVAQ